MKGLPARPWVFDANGAMARRGGSTKQTEENGNDDGQNNAERDHVQHPSEECEVALEAAAKECGLRQKEHP